MGLKIPMVKASENTGDGREKLPGERNHITRSGGKTATSLLSDSLLDSSGADPSAGNG